MGDGQTTTTESDEQRVLYTPAAGLLFAQHRVWTTVAADHEEDGETIVDTDKIGEREEEWVGYFASRGDADDALLWDVGDVWDDVTVGTCASVRFGNCYVVRLTRPTASWFKGREWWAGGARA